MLSMILKMSAVTALYVALTLVLWKRMNGKTLSFSKKLLIGGIYGLCSVLSTHFGVDYQHMMINVRDVGPLSAGLFFDPFSGVMAGLIGGVERYIAGKFWGVGSYTHIACSVSTCLAGFLAAFLHVFILKRKKPSATYAFFMGAVMEVFHMYVVFITHREDMNMAFYVVRICATPMILFSGIGMAASSTVLKIQAGEWKNPFRKVKAEEVPLSQKFHFWLFTVTFAILALNFLFSFVMQTQTAIQSARDTLAAVSGDIRETYIRLNRNEDNIDALAGETARTEALAIAEAAGRAGGLSAADGDFLERMRDIYRLVAVTAVDTEGRAVASAGETPVYKGLLFPVMEGSVESMSEKPSSSRIIAGAKCGDGMIQTVMDKNTFAQTLNLSQLNEALSYFHVGSEGTFDIFRSSGLIIEGDHRGRLLSAEDRATLQDQPADTPFTAVLFNTESLCRIEHLDDSVTLLTALPVSEMYANRNIQAYENALADILLFTVIYVLISMLVQSIVVRNLDLVNASLDRITNGNLDEVVSVRNSSEFASLSNDINQTVTVLKGYIEAAEKRIEQELELARTIQDSALPKNFSFPRSDFELFATMDPAKEVGGDFYDFFFVDQHKLALVIADVSGKGIPAALFMMRAKTAVRGFAETGKTPAEIMRLTNNTLCEGNSAGMFVTVWVGIIDLTTGLMTCSNAGHEYPVLMRCGGAYEVLKDKHGLVLAGMEGVRFREYELQLHPGDKLFVYTDGIPEAIDKDIQQYGMERLVHILNAVKDEPMQTVLPAVRQDINAFVGEADQFDDITMLGFSYFGPQGSGQSEA